MGTFISMVDTNIVNISLPVIANHYNAGVEDVSPIVAFYALALSCSVLLWGKAADRYGFSRIFILAFTLFTAASALCTFAGDLHQLIIYRIIQGIGGGGIAAVGPAIIARDIAHHNQGKAYGFIGTTAALGLMMGAPLGGIITGYFDWRGIFLINIPLGLIAVAASYYFLPKDILAKISKSIDWLGGILSVSFLALLMWLVPEKGAVPDTTTVITTLIVLGIMGICFIKHEKKHPEPLVPTSVMTDGQFLKGVCAGFIFMIGIGALNITLPFHLIDFKHMTPERAGFVMMIFSGVHAICNPLAGRLADKFQPQKLALIGAAGAVPVSLFFAFTADSPSSFSTYAFLIMYGVIASAFIPTSMTFVMQTAPAEHKGAAGGVNMTARGTGIALGTAVFGAIMSYTHGSDTPMRIPWLISAAIYLLTALVVLSIVRKSRQHKG